ncbi:hypothetical protein RHSIM_Rhsim02G0240200 [Rhododendron simsii]|uniref:Uncharacterized protein n=1 Tax=Rhododendron simsii TaxID=118357 RepID=A0A834LS49_RHOSS|nr:hypothetical protein RHSIM_Rhsim02G0240200 [Rhododendron simsii]
MWQVVATHKDLVPQGTRWSPRVDMVQDGPRAAEQTREGKKARESHGGGSRACQGPVDEQGPRQDGSHVAEQARGGSEACKSHRKGREARTDPTDRVTDRASS